MWLRSGRLTFRRLLRLLPAGSPPLLQRVACETSSTEGAAIAAAAAAAAA